MQNVLDKLLEKVSAVNLFRTGPFSRFENSKRIYLDQLGDLSCDDLSDFVVSKIKEELGDTDFFIALVFEEYGKSLTNKELELAKSCGIDADNPIESVDFYDADDELYCFVRAYECQHNKIRSVVRASLARHLGTEPYFMAELFIVSIDGKELINVYDDRGMDIVSFV